MTKIIPKTYAFETMINIVKILNPVTGINYNTLLMHSLPRKRTHLFFILQINII